MDLNVHMYQMSKAMKTQAMMSQMFKSEAKRS